MRKHFIFFYFLLVSVCSFAQKPNYNIGILLDNRTEEMEPLLQKIQNQIIAVVGEDANIIFSEKNILVNNYNLENARLHYNTLVSNDTDIILAFGVVNNEIVSKQSVYEKPTILFGAVNRDFSSIDFSKTTSGIDNFTYLIESESYNEDFIKFKTLTNYKTLGILVEDHMVNLLPLKDTFDKEFEALDASYKLIPFKTVSDITSNLDDIDAVYLASGFFLKDDEVKLLAQAFIDKKLPSFTSNGIKQVEQGLMVTNQSQDNLNQFIRRISLSVEGYINGTPLSEMPVFIDFSERLTINFNTTELVGIPIKYSLINDTDFVGKFENVISEKQYNLIDVINTVLDQNLSLQSIQKDVELSGQDLKTAKSNYLPSLTAAANGTYTDPNLAEISNGQSPEFQTAGNITLQQTVFSEAANANISIQKSVLQAQQENFNAEQLNSVFDASNAYFNALILKANLQIQMGNLELTRRNLQIAEQNYEAGESGKSDLLRFRSQMAQNTQAMVEAINQLEQSFVTLNQLLNNPVNTEISIEDVNLDQGFLQQYNYDSFIDLLDNPKLREPFIEFLIQESKNNAPELKALDYNLDATERNIKLNSYGRFLPTIALQGQYNRVFDRNGIGSKAPPGTSFLDDNYNIALNVSIPILNSNQTNINRQTAIIQKDQLNINKENTELALSANIRNSVLNIINQISNIELSKVSEETAKEALDLTQTSYSNGAVNIVQLIDAQNNYLSARVASVSAVYNYLINALQMERFLGYYFLLNDQAKNNEFNQRFLEYLNTRN
ncbi:TolC family protein [Psychroserpens luteolus]|uniref:TolC family protein n=1 Tax=Psychroserpens luteolus TaxID=2855840 RepID=UPI001E654AED|nr:TolC family protein [Psychroserpens luteolus]MCD2257798.1 TolC family protein [Psychroserpens luteolus]